MLNDTPGEHQWLTRAARLLLAIPFLFAAPSTFARVIPGEYIVVLKQGHSPADVAQTHGLEARHTYAHALNGFAGSIPDGRLNALANDPRVALIEPDQTGTVASQVIPTGVSRIGATRAPGAKIDGIDERVNVDIAILDTGIDLAHPDLNVVSGVSFIKGDSSNGNDAHGHGTHVAGIAAALDNNIGVVGVAPGARLWAVKVLDDSGNGTISTLIKGIDYVTQNAARISVANMSLVFIGTSSTLRTAIQNSVAKGVVYVAAAGNAGHDVWGADGIFNTADDTIPAAFPEVITVSALSDYDGVGGALDPSVSGSGPDDALASFSNYGKKVDLAAPGVLIYSTTPTVRGSYGTLTGTSMAAPHVAGAAALSIALRGRPTDAAGVSALRQALVSAAEPQSAWGPANTLDPDGSREPLVNVADASIVNNPPAVSILSPAPGTQVSDPVMLSAQAVDDKDGDISAAIIWSSSLDGVLGTGAQIAAALSPGTHTLTATASDSAGQSSVALVTVLIPSASTPTLQCAVATDRPGYITRDTAAIRVSATCGSTPISGATVQVAVRTASGRIITTQGVSDAAGFATASYVVNAKKDGVGTYSVTATVAKSGYLSASAATSFVVTR